MAKGMHNKNKINRIEGMLLDFRQRKIGCRGNQHEHRQPCF